MSEKLTEFSILTGKTIVNVSANKDYVRFNLLGGVCDIDLHDDGPQNDSHAFFFNFEALNSLTDKVVASAVDTEINSDNCEFKLTFTDGTSITFESVHEHNGYYGYSYQVNYTALKHDAKT